jgi:hypothetical protein
MPARILRPTSTSTRVLLHCYTGQAVGRLVKVAVCAPPPAMVSYRVVAAQGVVVRKEFHLTSPQCGNLRRGEVIDAQQTKSDVTRITRIQFSLTRKYGEGTVAGWVPLAMGSKVMLEEVKAAAPAPAPKLQPASTPKAARRGPKKAAPSSSSEDTDSSSDAESDSAWSSSDHAPPPKRQPAKKRAAAAPGAKKKQAAPAPEVECSVRSGQSLRVVATSGALVRREFFLTSSQVGQLHKGEVSGSPSPYNHYYHHYCTTTYPICTAIMT